MRRHAWIWLLILIGLLTIHPSGTLATIDYTFSSIDVPGSALTFLDGINDRGEIVGVYDQGSCGTPPGACEEHGFLYSGGSFTTIDDPLATCCFFGEASGINDKGQIVGHYELSGPTTQRGFLYSGGSFSPIDVPFPGVTGTEPSGINHKGEIVGHYEDTSGTHGFRLSRGIFSAIDVPFAGVTATQANGINHKGEIVGSYQDATGTHGFRLSGGTFSAIDVPFVGVTATEADGINRKGHIVGTYEDATGTHGFLAIPLK